MTIDGQAAELDHGHVVIAAITSCTNTSNPSVMLAAGLLAKNAVERGLKTRPWVKTSLAPGSRVVTDYYDQAGLTSYLNELGFDLVGYGCTTCIGNSGPLIAEVSTAVTEHDLNVAAVLSGNRNFEGRIHAETRMNFLASPPLVIAYALAGTMNTDLTTDPLGRGADGEPVYLRDIWPTTEQVEAVVGQVVQARMFTEGYSDVFAGDENWRSLDLPSAEMFAWDDASTYVRRPPYFDGMPREPEPLRDITGARALAVLGDSVTTDHISPAGSIRRDSPAGQYLLEHGVKVRDFNSYGSRRGNHEVMIRGTFANIRLRNQLVPGVEGGFTRHLPDGEQLSIFDAAQSYAAEGVPLVVLAGAEYGSGSSRDWAAKGTVLLGVRAVLAESFERIHRSNLIGMGVLPLQYPPGESARTLGLTGEETFTITGLAGADDGAGRGHRPRRGRSRSAAVRRGGTDRHPRGAGVLPPRRHPAVRPAPSPRRRRREERRPDRAHPSARRLTAEARAPAPPRPGSPAQHEGSTSCPRASSETTTSGDPADPGGAAPLPRTRLLDRKEVAERTVAFYFEKPPGFEYKAGQFADYTLLHPSETDSEGDIRGFTLTSAPYEPRLMATTRLRDTAFKRVLRDLPIGTELLLDAPYGSFTLHHNAARPAVFLAGGIGITPVRSISLQAAHEGHRPPYHRLLRQPAPGGRGLPRRAPPARRDRPRTSPSSPP